MLRIVMCFICIFCINTYGNAETQVYKCTKNGSTSFSQTPCDGQTSKTVSVKSHTPTAEEIRLATKENNVRQKEYDKLVKLRHAEEAKADAQNRVLAREAANRRKQCDSLKLKSDWAREDYRKSQGKSQEHAQTKLRRSEQVLAMKCGNV